MNNLDKQLVRVQEDNIQEIDPLTATGVAVVGAVGTALIIANLILVLMEVSSIKRATKTSKEHSKIINDVLGRKDIKVNIYKDKVPNAFAAGGKHIFLTTGLIKILNKRELTAVMLHEVYHNEKKHLYKQLAYEYPFYYILTFLSISLFASGAYIIIAFLAFKIGLAIAKIPYKILIGRKHEYDADNYATKYGYGDDMISAFKKFEAILARHASKTECGNLCKLVEKIDRSLDEHPSFKNRIERVLKNKEVLKAALSGGFGKLKKVVTKLFK